MLAVVCHDSAPFGKRQNLHYQLLDMERRSCVCQGMPVSGRLHSTERAARAVLLTP